MIPLPLLPAAALAAALVTVPAAPAGAASGTGCTGYAAGHAWFVQCQSGGDPGGSSGGGGHQACSWTSNVDHYFPGFTKSNPPPKQYIYVIEICPGTWPNGNQPLIITLVRNGAALTPVVLARQAYAELAPPQPDPATAPPRGHDGLVGLPEWFWIPAAQWHPLTRRIAVGPVWAEVTATPSTLTFGPGNGLAAVSCTGPGTTYDRSKPASAQQSNCTYTYARSSTGLPGNAYTAGVTITWTASWRGSGGAGGTFPALTRTTSFTLPVAEGQALVTGGNG